MPAEDAAAPQSGSKVCGRCGAAFACGLAAGRSRCWCAELPHVMPLDPNNGECLCPECLRTAVAQRLESE